MHEFLFFMIGFLLGGIIGVTIMCLMQINRIHGGSNARKEDEELGNEQSKNSFGFQRRKHRTCRRKQRKPA